MKSIVRIFGEDNDFVGVSFQCINHCWLIDHLYTLVIMILPISFFTAKHRTSIYPFDLTCLDCINPVTKRAHHFKILWLIRFEPYPCVSFNVIHLNLSSQYIFKTIFVPTCKQCSVLKIDNNALRSMLSWISELLEIWAFL